MGKSCSLGFILTICNLSYFPFLGLDLGSECFISWSLLTCYFPHEQSPISGRPYSQSLGLKDLHHTTCPSMRS